MEQNNGNVVQVRELTGVYVKARTNLLIMTLLSLVNVVLIIIQSSITFAFSAYAPTVFVVFGAEFEAVGVQGGQIIGSILALVAVGLYGLCYFMSKKSNVWVMIALILFSADALLLLLFVVMALPYFEPYTFVNIAFIGYIMYHLVKGTISGNKLKKLLPHGFVLIQEGDPIPVFGGSDQQGEPVSNYGDLVQEDSVVMDHGQGAVLSQDLQGQYQQEQEIAMNSEWQEPLEQESVDFQETQEPLEQESGDFQETQEI